MADVKSSVFNLNETLEGYLGKSFQKRLISHAMLNKEFGGDIIKALVPQYFDDQHYKKLFILIKNYFNEYNSIPNAERLQNIINTEHTEAKQAADKEILNSILKGIGDFYHLKQERGDYKEDQEFVIKMSWDFIRQQEYKRAINESIKLLKTGKLGGAEKVTELFKNALSVGASKDYGVDVYDNPEGVLEDDYRNPIPTMIPGLDPVMDGGPGGGQACIILAPSGMGKTTMLSRIAHGARECGKNVVQIIFEDMPKDIQRKHYSMMSKVPLSELSKEKEFVLGKVQEYREDGSFGRLIIKKFKEDETTIPDIKDWILEAQKRLKITFDLVVLDYLDCVEAHKEKGDLLHEQIVVMKSFMTMIEELDVPGWSAIQGNRESMSARVVAVNQMGGNIKRAQKGHFIISVGGDMAQKESGLANFAIVKCRWAQDGMVYENCVFDRNTLEIRLTAEGMDASTYVNKGSGGEQAEIMRKLMENSRRGAA